ncbi:MAG: phosphoribosylformylglycinamidine synthase subunit PurQ [Alphaproteobacteria bacterium]
MRTAIVVFPGSNCDRDAAEAIKQATGQAAIMAWHGDADLPSVDLIILPGGFSYGDYLRTGAMAAHSPIMKTVIKRAHEGVRVLGICNGFQILCETQLLPGVLLRNSGLKFIAKPVGLSVANTNTDFTRRYAAGQELTIPVAHGEGNYFADGETLKKLRDNGQIVFRYTNNPNGSADDIAGIVNERGNVMGMMPHPERVIEPLHGNTDGMNLFKSLVESLS